MNISRLYSLLYQQNYSVGRVQTPTLAMIVKRDDEINNFKKEKYYTVELSMNDFTLFTDRIDNLEIAEQLKNLIGENTLVVAVLLEARRGQGGLDNGREILLFVDVPDAGEGHQARGEDAVRVVRGLLDAVGGHQDGAGEGRELLLLILPGPTVVAGQVS